MPITEGGRYTPHDRIVSPGVFSRENDLSGIAQGVADIGAVVVAPFPKGPGFAPTVCNSVGELEDKFGIADGTYYGPYAAAEYLKEKGFVTVCRVGALTGYHQKYPFVIWAEKGTWNRAGDSGWIAPSSSYMGPSGLTYLDQNHETSAYDPLHYNYTGSIIGTNVPFTVTFMSGVGTANITQSNSGSQVYYGQTVYAGVGSFTTQVTRSIHLPNPETSGNIAIGLMNAGHIITLPSLALTGGTDPFTSATLLYASMSIGSLTCNVPVYLVRGVISGAIGPYTGLFTINSPTYEPCSASWSKNNGDTKVIAVLGDTQNATIDSTLHAPGFAGSSSFVYTPTMVSANSIGTEFNLTLYQTNADTAYGTYNFSLDPSSVKYITSVFGTDATIGNPDNYVPGTKVEAAYLYKFFENDLEAVLADPSHWRFSGASLPSGSNFDGELMNFTDANSLDLTNGDSQFGLTNAYSPWIISQEIATWGNASTSIRYPLFKVNTLTDGTNANTSYKIEISNVKLAGTVAGTDWGTFTLTVRDYSDTDRKPKILESFNNLSLDPNSPNYVARRIGDRYNYIRYDGKIIEFGDFNNLSKYVRIEMSSNPVPVTAVPYGFQAYALPINSSLGFWCNPVAYSKASTYGLFPGKYPSGVVFDDAPTGADAELSGLYPTSSANIGVSNDNKQYFAPLPSFGAYSSVGQNTIFALDMNITGSGVKNSSFAALSSSVSNAIPAVYQAANETTYVKMRKFVFGLQGGFDGQSPAIPINIGKNISAGNNQGLNCATSTAAGSIAYNQCVGALGNADEFDINLISTPGIIYSLHSYVTTLVIDMCETRGDCFYIPDLYLDDGNPSSGQIDEVVALAAEFDTSYAGAYYPWIKIKNTYTNTIETIPPSVILPAIYAANDRVAGEWWAVAGLGRGGIAQAVQVTDRTTHSERDTLYEGRVNPIAAFPGQGISVWGQKTLQVASSALDRINVRRLLIEIKKFFASTARFLVFEQNTAQTRNRFLAIVNPYLESVQQRSGLYAFQVVMDDSNNTPDLIDRNILYGQIWLKPTKVAEFIVLDFNILPSGASFPTA
jgi:hypothetical protein